MLQVFSNPPVPLHQGGNGVAEISILSRSKPKPHAITHYARPKTQDTIRSTQYVVRGTQYQYRNSSDPNARDPLSDVLFEFGA